MFPTTAQQIAMLRTAPPPSELERELIEKVQATFPELLPQLTTAQAGEALVQFGALIFTLLKQIKAMDPFLDWESRINVAINVIGVAGAALFEAGTAAGPET